MQVQGVSQEGSIKLTIAYPRVPNLTFNFRLTIIVTTQQLNGRNEPLLNKVLYTPERKVAIGPFDGGKIYKVTCQGVVSGQDYSKTIFVFVGAWGEESQNDYDNEVVRPARRPQSSANRHYEANQIKRNAKEESTFSNSQDLMKMVGKSVGITNQKTLDRFILKGRNCRNTRQFVGKRNSDCLKKQEMLIKGKIILNDVYKQKEGMQFFKNDWFMGPFYSYNHNEKKMTQ